MATSSITRILRSMARENLRQREPPLMKLISGQKKMLDQDKGANVKHYKYIPSVELFRMAASGEDNCCWFDSFLQCTSPQFRAMKLDQRLNYVHAFRDWCRDHQVEIYFTVLERNEVYELLINMADFFQEMNKTDEEIETMAGWIVAAYFGYNLVFLPHDKALSDEIAVFCASAQQVVDRKVIFMHFTGNHFEPVGHIELNEHRHLDESKSKFVFDWRDERLCGVKAYYEKQRGSKVCQAAYGVTIPSDSSDPLDSSDPSDPSDSSWESWNLPNCEPKTRKKANPRSKAKTRRKNRH